MLVNEYGDNIAKYIFRNMNPIKCVEDECLGIDHVDVLIIKITIKPIERNNGHGGHVRFEGVATLSFFPRWMYFCIILSYECTQIVCKNQVARKTEEGRKKKHMTHSGYESIVSPRRNPKL